MKETASSRLNYDIWPRSEPCDSGSGRNIEHGNDERIRVEEVRWRPWILFNVIATAEDK